MIHILIVRDHMQRFLWTTYLLLSFFIRVTFLNLHILTYQITVRPWSWVDWYIWNWRRSICTIATCTWASSVNIFNYLITRFSNHKSKLFTELLFYLIVILISVLHLFFNFLTHNFIDFLQKCFFILKHDRWCSKWGVIHACPLSLTSSLWVNSRWYRHFLIKWGLFIKILVSLTENFPTCH